MNLKRILSTALTVVMIFTTVVAVLPITASAAYSSGSNGSSLVTEYEEADLNNEQLKAYLSEYLSYNFDTALEMLDHELKAGYLYSVNSANNLYSMYINKYTGFVYYVNNTTYQVLTSNPINPGYLNNGGSTAIQSEYREDLMSQITVSFFETANSLNKYTYTSHKWAASRAQISVSAISGGFRVNYTLGDTTARFLLPGRITAESFETNILVPMIKNYEELLEEYCGEELAGEVLTFFEGGKYIPYEYGCINSSSGKSMGLKTYLTDTSKLYDKVLSPTSSEIKALDALRIAIIQLSGAYTLNAPQKYIGDDRYTSRLEEMYNKYPITKDGTAIYVYTSSELSETKRPLSDIIKKYCPDYTFAMMFEDEKICDYVDKSLQKPVIRCALEYTFNSDGSLSVRLPANSITFDESAYTLTSITPLKFFGCGDMKNEGYIFYPDGSGTIVEFDDFYNEASNKKISFSLSSSVYGKDYCYSEITGTHRQMITMPVFGLVNEVKANSVINALYGQETVTNGFFAIVEEGSALAELGFQSGGVAHRFAGCFASYNPYPSDKFDLSETISVGSLGEYTIVSESKYTGSYVTRYVMLTDEDIGNTKYGANKFYKSDYVGMAAYYRNYLKDTGVIEALELSNTELPLYIETLGAMDIITRILTFPVTKSIPLTTFEDVQAIYEQLTQCETFITEQIAKYEQLAAEEKDQNIAADYIRQAERYKELVGKVENLKNINFKLTGYTNGGLKSTYPTKVKWMSSCGGKSGFENLYTTAASISATDGMNFGVFPEFDFMYINNTSLFDGIRIKGNVSRMVDNRYASRQEYDNILQEFDVTFSLVISTDALDKLYSKFISKFDNYDIKTISVSTMGSSLNSNFYAKQPVNREESKDYVVAILDRMVNQDGYEVMIDAGNIYAAKYADHILNAAIDSSHFRYSSYAIPFTGLVLHSYVNYTSTPLNYSGSPEYDILRSIENGASLYYILCYQNSAYLKEDEDLNDYYGVDYHNWYDSILLTYKELNDAIGDLQSYEIVDHKILFAERVIEESEMLENFETLQNEILEMVETQLKAAIDEAFNELKGDSANINKRVKVVVDRAALLNQFSELINRDVAEIDDGDFKTKFDALIAKYQDEYPGDDANGNSYVVNFSQITYDSKYSYVTDSFATDKDYVYTKYTCDNGNVTMVTYSNGTDSVSFLLNYNMYSVTIKLDGNNTYTLGAQEYIRIG